MNLRVGLICGGPTSEHEVSILSAQNIYKGLEANDYVIYLIYIDQKSNWYFVHQHEKLFHHQSLDELTDPQNSSRLSIVPGDRVKTFVSLEDPKNYFSLDVIFPASHGRMMEDGALQGLMECLNIPYVGSRVLSSAINMDKEVTKRLLSQAGILVPRWLSFYSHEELEFEMIVEKLGLPFFLKPTNTGSSVGVKKIKSKSDYHEALKIAEFYDRKLIAEKYIQGREIEIAVLGEISNNQVSLAAEIIPQEPYEFYTYEAKYLDADGAKLVAPVHLSEELFASLQAIAKKAFYVLCCEGLARVDFFLHDNQWYLNEINTLPGFTNLSMYPHLFELAGKSQKELIRELVEFGLKSHAQTKLSC